MNDRVRVNTGVSTTNTATQTFSTSVSSSDQIALPRSNQALLSGVERAVFEHIRALRALGHVRVNTYDIAVAMRLPLADVEKTIATLESKGVRVAA